MDDDEPSGDSVIYSAPLRRFAPPEVADERDALEGWLDHFRAIVVASLDGLDEPSLRRRVPAASGPSLLGIVAHLTELERTWLVERWGERGTRPGSHLSYVDEPGADARISDLEEAHPIVDTYLAVCERGRDALAGAESLDDVVRDDRRGHIELRWILLHLITETARWAGQAQVLRQIVLDD